MTRHMRLPITACVLALLAPSSGALAQSRPLDAVAADRVRVTAHLERVEAELSEADLSHLTDAQRSARETNIARLRAYRLRGEFPHGSAQQPGMRAPTFIDAGGRACAMGHLVIESGHREVAEAIARDQNYARVPEITHAALRPWLAANGMTLAEATRVQPSYCAPDGGSRWCAEGGFEPVCGADGNVYENGCFAMCEEVRVVGQARCDDAGLCSCDDAGPASADAGSADAGVETEDGGCSASPGGSSSSGGLLLGLVAGLFALRRRGR